jgi:hypothetical protein
MARQSGRDGGSQTLKGVVVVVVLVALGIAVLARAGGSHAPSPAAARQAGATTTTTVPSSTTTTTLVPAAQIKLQVLNGVGTGSLAGEWSNKLKANPGYQTLTPLNATARVTSSSIYVVTPGFVPEADALASVVGLPTSAVNTTTPPPSSAPIPSSALSNANLVLVIGPDLAASA